MELSGTAPAVDVRGSGFDPQHQKREQAKVNV